jgi:hypothetical protein
MLSGGAARIILTAACMKDCDAPQAAPAPYFTQSSATHPPLPRGGYCTGASMPR